MTKNPIVEALALLDTKDDAHWTEDGLPRLDVVTTLTGLDKVTRDDLLAVAPKFTRESPVLAEKTGLAPVANGKEPEGEDALSLAREALKEKMEEIAAQEQVVDREQKKLAHLRSEGQAIDKLVYVDPSDHRQNQKDLMEFIAGQHKLRMERHASRQAVLKGLNAADIAALNPRSKLDQALARKTSRGGQRPQFNATGTGS